MKRPGFLVHANPRTQLLLLCCSSIAIAAIFGFSACDAQEGDKPDGSAPEATFRDNPVMNQITTAKYASTASQREAVDFLWTPGLLLQQVLKGDGIIIYPEE
ncbi:MAG: hypothetical protein RLZZ458_2142 [Planctomycetota bacterium]|jgi:hypothetical protein